MVRREDKKLHLQLHQTSTVVECLRSRLCDKIEGKHTDEKYRKNIAKVARYVVARSFCCKFICFIIVEGESLQKLARRVWPDSH